MGAATPATVGAARPAARLGRRRADAGGIAFQAVLVLCLLTALAFLVLLLSDVVRAGISVLTDRGVDFLTSKTSSRPERYGVSQGIRGSLVIMVFTAVLAFPVGIASAIYLEEYARPSRLKRFIEVNIRNLAGVPSVVYGLLGLAVFVKFLGGDDGRSGLTGGRSVISAGLTMAVLVLPIVIITASEALRAVPSTIREAGYGIGAAPSDVVFRLVVPQAIPGILTGTVLALGRAVGETAPLILVGAATGLLRSGDLGFVEELRAGFTALPMQVYNLARQPSPELRELAGATSLVLLVLTVLGNTVAIVVRNRYSKRRVS